MFFVGLNGEVKGYGKRYWPFRKPVEEAVNNVWVLVDQFFLNKEDDFDGKKN